MIRLLIADDHPVVREGLRRIVTDCEDMTVVGEAASGDEVIQNLTSAEVDVLLSDISMPGVAFLEVMRWVRQERPRVRVLVLSVHPEDQYAIRAFRAGAVGYLTKDHSPSKLAGAIRRVYAGGRYITPALAERLAFQLGGEVEAATHEALSDREYEILCLIASGKSIKEIGASLVLSPKTVSTYRARILKKLQVKTTADLVRYAVEHELSL